MKDHPRPLIGESGAVGSDRVFTAIEIQTEVETGRTVHDVGKGIGAGNVLRTVTGISEEPII